MGRLTAAGVKAVSKPGLHGDGHTLYLLVKTSGAKSWIQRVAISGKRRDIGLGGWPVVSLAKARQRAFANRVAIADGFDPLAEKRKARMPTFREAAIKVYAANRPRWRSAKTAANWLRQMELHAFPILADLSVDQVTREAVLRVLAPVWGRKLDVARKLRGRIRAVLAWAQAHGHVEVNVAGEAIDGALAPMPAVEGHYRALPHPEVATALDTIEASRASVSARLCLRFVVLTACRSGEARLATWNEIDLEARTWRVPAVRMKGGAEHRVALSDAALDVLESVRPLRDRSDRLFPSPSRPGKPLSNMSLTKILRDTGLAGRATVHGFRSSFRDWCADTGKPREIAEAALAHTVGGVEGAYFRSDLFERRRRLMGQWAAYVTDSRGKVVRLHG